MFGPIFKHMPHTHKRYAKFGKRALGAIGGFLLCGALALLAEHSVQAAGRYGTPLKFEDPPVDIVGSPAGNTARAQEVVAPKYYIEQPKRARQRPQVQKVVPEPKQVKSTYSQERQNSQGRSVGVKVNQTVPETGSSLTVVAPPAAVPVQPYSTSESEAEAKALVDNMVEESTGSVKPEETLPPEDAQVNSSAQSEAAAPAKSKKVVRLFNTADLFRKPIKGVVPQWERVVAQSKKKKHFSAAMLMNTCLPMFTGAGRV